MEKTARKQMVVVLVVIGFISFACAFVFAFLGNAPVNLNTQGNTTVNSAPGIFIQDIETLGKKYPNTIGPASWVFAVIWPVIFMWNTVGTIYMVVSLFLPVDRSPVKRDPALLPMGFLACWSLSWASSVGWLFTYDREYFGAALFFLILAAWSGYAALVFSYRSYFPDIVVLEEQNSTMLWLVRILIHNGFSIYVTWVTCAWKLNFETVISYVDSRGVDKIPADTKNLSIEDAGTVALSLLLVEVIAWFILENFVFEKYCRYTLTIYPTLIFAFSGIFVRNYVYPFSRNQVFTVVGLSLASLFLIARVILVARRHKQRLNYA